MEDWEKALDWRPGWHQRPNHRPEARFGAELEAAQIGQPSLSHISSQRRPRMHPLPQQRGHPFTSSLMLHYWKDIETLIGKYWNTGLQGQIDALEKRILCCSVTTKWKKCHIFKAFESNYCRSSMILLFCHDWHPENLNQSNFFLKNVLSLFRGLRSGGIYHFQ